MSEISRFRGAVAALALAVVLAACGSDGGGSATTAASTVTAGATSAPATAAPTTGETTATTIAGGTTAASTTTTAASTAPAASTLAEDLGRVVVLAEEPMLADVLSLGVRPVASSASVVEAGFQGMDDFDTAGIEVLPMTTLNLEQLAALRPDTIITLQFWADQISEDVLRGAADRIILVPDGLSIPDRVTYLGEQFGRQSQAAALVTDLEAAETAAAAKVPDDCVISLVAIYPGPAPAVFVAGPWDIPSAVLAAGCRLVPDASVVTPDRNGRVHLSTEQLGLLDAPRIVLLQSDTVEGEDASVAEIETNPLWANLPAVQADRVTVFDRLGYPGAAGQIRFYDEFAALMS
ncbi:MAG: ABC transporter substrate-binding protein [Ilumatobacteraceae bacterium]